MRGLTKAIAFAKDTQGAAAGTKPHLFRYIYNAGNAIR